jgi:predicted metal-binding protein
MFQRAGGVLSAVIRRLCVVRSEGFLQTAACHSYPMECDLVSVTPAVYCKVRNHVLCPLNIQEENLMQPSPLRPSAEGRILVTDRELEKYCSLAVEAGATHAKQIHPSSVVTAPWVRLKCQFGCPGYGKGHCCPPHTPTSDETRAILDCYHRALLFHIEVPLTQGKEKHHQKYLDTLIELEAEMFKDQYYKAFLFLAGPCRQCKKCGALEGKPCASPWKARPSMEGCGIDVYQTARNNGLFVQTLRERTDTNNWYCLMMVD